MDKPSCICIIDAHGMRDVPACPSCHPGPPAAAPEPMGFEMLPDPAPGAGRSLPPLGPPGQAFHDWTPGEDFLELTDEGDTEAQIQAIFDEQEDCGQAGCGGGCSICSPDS